MTVQAFANLVQTQFNKWQSLPDSYVTFRYTGLCNNDPSNRNDGVNTIGWGRLSGSAAGVTFPGASQESPYRRSPSGDLLESDVIIDVRTAASVDLATYMNILLPVIVLHEEGHFLGLGHSERGCSVMTPSSLQLEFCDDDAAGVRALYPGPQRAADLVIGDVSCGPGGAEMTFRWSASPEADGYFFDITLDPGFNGWLGFFAGGRTTSAVRLPGVIPGAVHFWRIWSFSEAGGGHTYGQPFVAPNCRGGVRSPAGPSGLTVNAFCTAGKVVGASFSWIRSLSADGYFVDLTLDPGFGGFINALTSDTGFTWFGLLPGTRHYYRVFALNANGGAHSHVDSFTTPIC